MLPDNLMEQTQRYVDATGDPVGDCFRTALACLMEMPRDEVPHFIDLYKHEEGPSWWHAAVEWVEEKKPGWTLVCLPPKFPVYYNPEDSPQRVILSGKSPRGEWNHSVIADAVTGDMLWDPSPYRAGIDTHIDVLALMRAPEWFVSWMEERNTINV